MSSDSIDLPVDEESIQNELSSSLDENVSSSEQSSPSHSNQNESESSLEENVSSSEQPSPSEIQQLLDKLNEPVQDEKDNPSIIGFIGCLLILGSLGLPYIGGSGFEGGWSGYEMLDFYEDIVSTFDLGEFVGGDGDSSESTDSESSGVDLGMVGLLLLAGLPVWNLVVGFFGLPTAAKGNRMMWTGLLHLFYTIPMAFFCFTYWDGFLFEAWGIGIWTSILGGFILTGG